MKLGVFSDVHGNLRAFKKIMEIFGKKQVDALICLGDVVGYLNHSLEILDTIIKFNNIQMVMGNHEAALLGIINPSPHRWALYNLESAKRNITKEQQSWILHLPTTLQINIENKKLAFFHGSPWNPLEEYIYPDSQKLVAFLKLDFDFIFLGHTHYQMEKKIGKITIANPGSVGLPRDGTTSTNAAIFDSSNGLITFLREKYDFIETINENRKAGVDEKVLEKLSGGHTIE